MNNLKTTIFKTLMALLGLFLVSSTSVMAQQVELEFGGNISGRPGDSFTIPVTTSDLDGLDVYNFEFEFSFDSDLINVNVDSIEAGPLVSSITKNVTNDDRILVNYASSDPIEGAGVLFTISGTFNNTGSNNTGLTLTDYLIGDGSLDVTPVTPYDVIVQVSETVVTLPTITGAVGSEFSAAISTDDLSGLDIYAYDLEINYDADVASLTGVSLEGTASEGGNFEFNTPEPGRALLSVAFSSAISSSSDVLAYLEGTLDDSTGGPSPLTFAKAEFFDSNGELVAIAGVSGSIDPGGEATFVVNFMAYLRLDDFDPASEDLYISGDFADWATPGSDEAYQLVPTEDDDEVYILTTNLEAGTYNYKYFTVPAGGESFDDGEWAGEPNRTIVVAADTTVRDLYGVLPGESVPIIDVRNRLEIGDPVQIEGIVTTPDFGFSSAEFYVQDETAGIKIYYAGVGGGNTDSPFVSGQNIFIDGEVGNFRFEELLIAPDSYEVKSEGNSLPDPVLITHQDNNQWSIDSDLQGSRVRLENIVLQEDSPWPVEKINSSSGLTVFADGNIPNYEGQVFDIRIDRDESYFDESPRPEGAFSLSGVMGRFQDNTQLFPFYENELGVATDIKEPPTNLPTEFALENNYPNPFNPTTNITYSVPEASNVNMVVFNAIGQQVSTLVNRQQSAGSYTVTFDAANLTSGVYFVRITAGSFVDSKKMLLLK